MEFEQLDSGTIYRGDCLEVLRSLPACSVDSVVTDPPAGISFMGREWDGDKGGRDEWVKWLTDIMSECCRIVRPGGHILVWALPRTSHWTATAIEDAGFEIQDIVTHVFGSGFPKSMDISKQIDRAAGVEREVVGYDASRARPNRTGTVLGDVAYDRSDNGATITAPATEAAKRWAGWGTALKPASEHWVLARKPSEEAPLPPDACRFFYCAKPSKAERNLGCGDLPERECGMMEDDNYPIKTGSGNLRDTKRQNFHPTVKPIKLMEYLIGLVTPSKGTVLDPFMGSGTTGLAAVRNGFGFVGIEREPDYFTISKARITHVIKERSKREPTLFDDV